MRYSGALVTYRGRFAPSPTGNLHLGSIATALVAWLRSRRAGGEFVLRVEDIDTPRVLRDSESRQLEDLRWLGFDWDEGPDVGGRCGPYRQSQRTGLYEAALLQLAAAGHTYLCDCSRGEIASVASAPHAGEDGPRYPGTCRRFGMQARAWRRPPAVRLAVPEGVITVIDAFQGRVEQDVSAQVGDFVLRRGDGVFAYQLAVVVDDAAMQISEVVRGCDLLSSTPRQILLAKLLGLPVPNYAHLPLILDADGNRLEKRNPRQTVAGLREAGVAPSEMLSLLASALGLLDAQDNAVTLKDLVANANLSVLQQCSTSRLPSTGAAPA